jgi:hypothetical protein
MMTLTPRMLSDFLLAVRQSHSISGVSGRRWQAIQQLGNIETHQGSRMVFDFQLPLSHGLCCSMHYIADTALEGQLQAHHVPTGRILYVELSNRRDGPLVPSQHSPQATLITIQIVIVTVTTARSVARAYAPQHDAL